MKLPYTYAARCAAASADSRGLPKKHPSRPRFGAKMPPSPEQSAQALLTIVILACGLLVATRPLASATASTTTFDHVVVGIMENHAYQNIIGNSATPYENTLAQQNALMTQSFAIGHPSEPNYHELWSGSNQGATDDSWPHTFTPPPLGQQLISAGLSTAIYSEDLPSNGSLTCSSGGY